MGLLLAAAVVLVGLLLFAACVISGLWDVVASLRRPSPRRTAEPSRAARGAAKLAAAALVGAVPWVAAPIAESSTGWVDDDHDGMLDGFVNGSYDWVDVNGGAWATAAAVLVVLIGVGLYAVFAAWLGPDAAARHQRRGPVVRR